MKLRCLDVGVGTNKSYKFNPKVPINCDEVFFIDIEKPEASLLRYGEWIVIDLESIDKLPFDDCFFDLIVMSHVLEHIRDWKKVLIEAYRVLKKDGELIIYVPNIFSKNLYSDRTHVNKFTIFSLSKFLRKLGFKISYKSVGSRIPGIIRVFLNNFFLLLADELELFCHKI